MWQRQIGWRLNVIWPFKKEKNPEVLERVETETLVAMRAARTVLRMHIGASFALSVASIICIAGLVGSVVFLGNQTVDHVLKVHGILQAVEQSTPVTHDTGGIVSNVFVSEGEIVSEGQILMSLDANDIESNLEEAQRTVAGLMLTSLCLKAERRGNTEIVVPPELLIALGRLNQLEKFRRSVRDCKGDLRKATLHRLGDKGALAALQNKVHLYNRLSHEGQSLRGQLHQLGRDSQEKELQDVLNQQQLVKTLQNLIKLSDLQKQLTKLKVAQKKSSITQTQRINQKLDGIIDALAQAEQRLSKLDRIKRNRFVYASNSGRVQRLRITKSGKRIARGAYILEIAPLSTDFEVLATVNVSELPYVHVGQQVTVSLSSGLPHAVAVPALIAKIVKATENTRTLRVALERKELSRRDLLIGERSLNGLGERSEALIEVKSENALRALGNILWISLSGTKI